jgi:nitrile hydratase subunit beta
MSTEASQKPTPAFRFQPGDRVRTRKDEPEGHCRAPVYLRGKTGTVERCLGHFRNPQDLAYGRPGLPKIALYMVKFPQAELWDGYSGSGQDTLVADVYEFWLDPA